MHFPNSLNPKGKKSWKTIGQILLLILVSLVFLTSFIIRHFLHKEKMSTVYPILILFLLTGIPGWFYGITLFLIYIGKEGFTYEMIPS